jgi:hypothetical protein
MSITKKKKKCPITIGRPDLFDCMTACSLTTACKDMPHESLM